MSDGYTGPEVYGDPTQQQLDEQSTMADVMGWRIDPDKDPSVVFRCDALVEAGRQAGEWVRCTTEIDVPTPGMDYTVEAYKIARAAMLEAGWTYDAEADYCPEHSVRRTGD